MYGVLEKVFWRVGKTYFGIAFFVNTTASYYGNFTSVSSTSSDTPTKHACEIASACKIGPF